MLAVDFQLTMVYLSIPENGYSMEEIQCLKLRQGSADVVKYHNWCTGHYYIGLGEAKTYKFAEYPVTFLVGV